MIVVGDRSDFLLNQMIRVVMYEYKINYNNYFQSNILKLIFAFRVSSDFDDDKKRNYLILFVSLL